MDISTDLNNNKGTGGEQMSTREWTLIKVDSKDTEIYDRVR